MPSRTAAPTRDDADECTNDLGPAGRDDHERVQNAHDQQREAGFAVADADDLVDLVHRVVERPVALPRLERPSTVLRAAAYGRAWRASSRD